jgi:hypothetical protein
VSIAKFLFVAGWFGVVEVHVQQDMCPAQICTMKLWFQGYANEAKLRPILINMCIGFALYFQWWIEQSISLLI